MLQDVQTLAKEASETVILVVDEEGIEPLISELLRGVGDSQVLSEISLFSFSISLSCLLTHSLSFCGYLWFQASVRRSSSYLIGYLFKNSKLYLVDEAPNMISTLIVLLSDSDSATVVVCLIQCSAVGQT